MTIRLYDSLTRSHRILGQREDGIPPVSPEHPFTFYTCGPTVYAPAHIGNFRTFIVNDVLRRMLDLEFGPRSVRHVRNLTDVDDRTIGQAKREKLPLAEITRKWTNLFHADCAALNLLAPHVEPTATGHIREQVDMIEVLMRKGHAYRAADGSVYFKIGSFPEYGALSRIRERELQATITAADDDHKDDISDFALWKAYKPEEDGDVQWPGPAGASAGRPGWHIECSAMSRKHLGETIDLHSGGVDLLFPHHENEIAQSQCCNGRIFARHWYHSEFLLVDGRKMSKSLGNLYTVSDLVSARGAKPLAVRYALLNGHPRKQLNFTLESLHAAAAALLRLHHFDEQIRIRRDPRPEEDYPLSQGWGPFQAVWDALADDLNFPAALGGLFTVINQPVTNFSGAEAIIAASSFRRICTALGLEVWKPALSMREAPVAAPAEVCALAERRWSAKKAKDFATADALRKEIAAAGWTMLDGKDGYKLAKAAPARQV